MGVGNGVKVWDRVEIRKRGGLKMEGRVEKGEIRKGVRISIVGR